MSRPQMLVVAAALGLAFSHTVMAAPVAALKRLAQQMASAHVAVIGSELVEA